MLTELGTGEALVSFLDEKGRPNIVERCTILPPQSMMGMVDDERRRAEIQASEFYGKYEEAVDNESAYELISAERAKAQQAAEEAQAELDAAKEQAAREKEEAKAAREKEKAEKEKQKKRKSSTAGKVANSAVNAIGRELGKSISRGILGTIKKWF